MGACFRRSRDRTERERSRRGGSEQEGGSVREHRREPVRGKGQMFLSLHFGSDLPSFFLHLVGHKSVTNHLAVALKRTLHNLFLLPL